jgi:hypothetical protein
VASAAPVAIPATTVHNQLAGLQGGFDNTELYHLTASEYSTLQANIGVAAYNQSNTIFGVANAAFNTANAANVWTNTVFGYANTSIAAANGWANTVVAGANAWTNAVFGYANTSIAASNGWANTVVAGANAWVNTSVTGANAWTNTVFGYSNTYTNTVGAASNGWANTVAAGANAWSNTKISSSGYTANTIFFANSAGYFSNSTNLQFFSSNNVLLLSGTINANVVTASNGSIASSVGYLGVPQNSQSTNYTLTISDQGKNIYVTANSTITIPANSSVSFPIGATISILTNANVTANVAITTDTLYLGGIGTTGTRTISSYGMATIIKVTATSWYISGAGVA